MPPAIERRWRSMKHYQPQWDTRNDGDTQWITAIHAEIQQMTTTHNEQRSCTPRYDDAQWTTTSHDEIQQMTMTHNEQWSCTLRYGDAQWTTTSYDEIQRTTTTHNERRPATTRYNEWRRHTMNNGHAHQDTAKHNEPLPFTPTYKKWRRHTMNNGHAQRDTTTHNEPPPFTPGYKKWRRGTRITTTHIKQTSFTRDTAKYNEHYHWHLTYRKWLGCTITIIQGINLGATTKYSFVTFQFSIGLQDESPRDYAGENKTPVNDLGNYSASSNSINHRMTTTAVVQTEQLKLYSQKWIQSIAKMDISHLMFYGLRSTVQTLSTFTISWRAKVGRIFAVPRMQSYREQWRAVRCPHCKTSGRQ